MGGKKFSSPHFTSQNEWCKIDEMFPLGDSLMGNSILLTTEQVLGWKKRRDEIVDMLSNLNGERALLDKKIEAAAMFMDNDIESDLPHTPEPPNMTLPTPVKIRPSLISSADVGDKTLSDAIITVLRSSGKPLSNAEIKRKLSGTGYDVDRLKASPNYYYTVTKRLADKGAVEKLPDGSYFIKKTEAPEGKPIHPVSSEASKDRRDYRPAQPTQGGRGPGPGGGT